MRITDPWRAGRRARLNSRTALTACLAEASREGRRSALQTERSGPRHAQLIKTWWLAALGDVAGGEIDRTDLRQNFCPLGAELGQLARAWDQSAFE